jgi:hypothetical protein
MWQVLQQRLDENAPDSTVSLFIMQAFVNMVMNSKASYILGYLSDSKLLKQGSAPVTQQFSHFEFAGKKSVQNSYCQFDAIKKESISYF